MTNNSSEQLISSMKKLYSNFDASSIEKLDAVYTQDVEFIDPVHRIDGLLGLRRYFRQQVNTLNFCRFHYISELLSEDKAFVHWHMEFSHPKIASGKTITMPGMTEVHFSDRIFYHCDSYDLGAMLYEHLPFVGPIIRRIRKILGS